MQGGEPLDTDQPSITTSAPAEIRIRDGRHVDTSPGAVQVGWHDVVVDELFIDPELTQPFSGVVRPGGATGDDGQEYTSLWGEAVESGAPLTMEGFRRGLSGFGSWGHLIVVISVLLFAISTAIAWSYYGDRCANYLFGAGAVLPYKIVFVIMHFVGAVLPLTVIWNLGDIFLAVVIIPNLVALILLAPQVVEETRSYFERKPWLENAEVHKRLKQQGRPSH